MTGHIQGIRYSCRDRFKTAVCFSIADEKIWMAVPFMWHKKSTRKKGEFKYAKRITLNRPWVVRCFK